MPQARNVGTLQLARDGMPHRTLFFMAGVNAATVRRSNALLGYGEKVTYCEGQSFPALASALGYLLSLVLFGASVAARALAARAPSCVATTHVWRIWRRRTRSTTRRRDERRAEKTDAERRRPRAERWRCCCARASPGIFRRRESQDLALNYMTLHYMALHYITLHYITLHYMT